jgi:hypothetical protein
MKLTEHEREQAENLLTEVLVLALQCGDHIRPLVANLAVGIADILPQESVNRSKEYAAFRYRENSKKVS